MCGKFTAMACWREVVAFSQPYLAGKDQLDREGGGGDGGREDGGDGSNDEIVTYRVGGPLPVIVWDAEAGKRRVVKMRWGFPDPRDWRRPRPIHARSETIDAKEPFRIALPRRSARHRRLPHVQRGRGGREAVGGTETRQWTIDPQDGQPRGFAFVWRRFEIADLPGADAGLRHGDGARQRADPPHGQVAGGRSPHAGDPGRRRLVDLAGRGRRNAGGGQGRAQDHGGRELAWRWNPRSRGPPKR